MSKINRTKYTILGLLTIEPMSGYDIKRRVEKGTKNFWSESLGQIYPTLAKLVQEKLVVCSEKAVGARTRKVYRITAKGRKELKEWLVLPAELPMVRDELLLKLYFGKNMSREECIEHIKREQQKVKDYYNYLRGVEKHVEDEHADMEDALYWQIVIKHGFHGLDQRLAWCDDALAILKKMP